MTDRAVRKTDVLVVDDHATFAESLARVLSLEPDLRARIARSGIEAERAVEEAVPDVVLMDVSLPGADGIEVTSRLLREHPGLPIVILSAHDDDPLRARAAAAGVRGYLSKFEPLDRVFEAIREVRAGRALMDRSDEARLRLQGKRRRIPHATERQRSERLSAREREILQLMADGFEPREISQQLGITPATLRTHVQNILTKLGVHSKTQAVLLAVRQGRVTARP
jgi:DNA-binding NarL/FixJ family response regulator